MDTTSVLRTKGTRVAKALHKPELATEPTRSKIMPKKKKVHGLRWPIGIKYYDWMTTDNTGTKKPVHFGTA